LFFRVGAPGVFPGGDVVEDVHLVDFVVGAGLLELAGGEEGFLGLPGFLMGFKRGTDLVMRRVGRGAAWEERVAGRLKPYPRSSLRGLGGRAGVVSGVRVGWVKGQRSMQR